MKRNIDWVNHKIERKISFYFGKKTTNLRKSLQNNKKLGGFPVGIDVFPETKGILLWGEPFNLTKTTTVIDPKTNQPKEISEEYYLIFMDTEGFFLFFSKRTKILSEKKK